MATPISSSTVACDCCEKPCDCANFSSGNYLYVAPEKECPNVGSAYEDRGIQEISRVMPDGTVCENIPCRACQSKSNPETCYRVVSATGEAIGNAACTTTPNISYAGGCNCSSGSASDVVKAALMGDFSVDCTNEASGFCRDRQGAIASFPASSLTSESVQHDPNSNFSTFTYLFEDCGTGSADYRYTIVAEFCGVS